MLKFIRFAVLIAVLVGFVPAHGGETSAPLELIRQAQARYLQAKDLAVSGTVHIYRGPPLRFRSKHDWTIAGQLPSGMYLETSGGESKIVRALIDDVYYVTRDSKGYGIKTPGVSASDLFDYIQKPETPGAANSNHGPAPFFFKRDLFTAENPCLDRIELLPCEVVNGTTCTVVSMGPCMYNDTVTYYLDERDLELIRLTMTTYYFEYSDDYWISVPTSAASEIYSVSVYDVENVATGQGIGAKLVASAEGLDVDNLMDGAEVVRDGLPDAEPAEVPEEGGPSDDAKKDDDGVKLFMAVDTPSETTVPLHTVASFDSVINSVAVRDFNGEKLIYTALASGEVKVLDPSGLQFDSLDLKLQEIQFPRNAPSSWMIATQEDPDTGLLNLVGIDTSESSGKPVRIGANAHWFACYVDAATSEPIAVFIEPDEQAMFMANARTGELIKKRTHVGTALGLLYDHGMVSGVMYSAPGWPLITELDLDLKLVRNRRLPAAMDGMVTDSQFVSGEYGIGLEGGQVGLLKVDDTFEYFRSPTWGYLNNVWEPVGVVVGPGTDFTGRYLEVFSEAGITLFDLRNRVLFQGRLVKDSGELAGAGFDYVYHVDSDSDGLLEVLCAKGGTLYLLNYGAVLIGE